MKRPTRLVSKVHHGSVHSPRVSAYAPAIKPGVPTRNVSGKIVLGLILACAAISLYDLFLLLKFLGP